MTFTRPGAAASGVVGRRGSLLLAALAAAVIAVAFQPLRQRAEHLANRVVYGRRATPYEVLAEFSGRMADAYATEVAAALSKAGLAVQTDLSNQKINAKVREHSLARVPVMLVVGRREAEGRTVSLRRLGGNAQQALALDDAVDKLKVEAAVPAAL